MVLTGNFNHILIYASWQTGVGKAVDRFSKTVLRTLSASGSGMMAGVGRTEEWMSLSKPVSKDSRASRVGWGRGEPIMNL
jgi:hypothetical protein